MKIMKQIIVATLLTSLNLMHGSAGKEAIAAKTAASAMYPQLSLIPGYQDWLSALTLEQKKIAINGISLYLGEDLGRYKNAKERKELLEELTRFLEENKNIVEKDDYARFSDEIKKAQAQVEEAQKRHAARVQMPEAFEKAIEDGDEKIVLDYLERHPEYINTVNEEGENPLVRALFEEKWNVHLIKELIKRTKDLNAKSDEGDTALHAAALSDDPMALKIIKLLVDRGADPKARDGDEDMPLALAIRHGNNATVEALLKYKISLDKVTHPDENIFIQAIRRLPEGKGMICESCDKVHHEPTEQEQIALLKSLIKHGADVNSTDTHKRTPLTTAISVDNEPVVKFLLDNKADIEQPFYSMSPLSYTITEYATEKFGSGFSEEEYNQKHKKRMLSIMKLLLERGADKEATEYGWTPLINAVNRGLFPIVELLGDSGANMQVHVPAYNFESPLALARWRLAQGRKEEQEEFEKIVEYLAKHAPEYKGSEGYKEKEQADVALVEPDVLPEDMGYVLEQFLAGPTKPSDITMNAIKKAVRGDYHSEFDALLNENIEYLLLQDEAQDTPLLLAIKYNKPDAIKTILAVVESMDEKEKNALLKQILHHHNAQGYNAQQLAYDLELKDISDLLAPYYKIRRSQLSRLSKKLIFPRSP